MISTGRRYKIFEYLPQRACGEHVTSGRCGTVHEKVLYIYMYLMLSCTSSKKVHLGEYRLYTRYVGRS